MKKYATRRPARVMSAALLLAASGLVATGGPAGAQTPDWAIACAATTENPWITSGYCERRQKWDKYYCQCAFVPDHPLPGFSGRRQHDLDADTFSDGDVTPN